MVTPFRADRALTRSLLLEGDFIKIYLTCSLGDAKDAILKGFIKRSKQVKSLEFTGISDPYES
ncbi:adenylylsulfate kinase-like protein [Bacillus methanolicus MGA3]|nr:adenylylsulfate kinase-like protein [Bacillus methanolicus MGA3]